MATGLPGGIGIPHARNEGDHGSRRSSSGAWPTQHRLGCQDGPANLVSPSPLRLPGASAHADAPTRAVR